MDNKQSPRAPNSCYNAELPKEWILMEYNNTKN